MFSGLRYPYINTLLNSTSSGPLIGGIITYFTKKFLYAKKWTNLSVYTSDLGARSAILLIPI